MGPALREDELQGRLRFLGGVRRRVGVGGGDLGGVGWVFFLGGRVDWTGLVLLV